MMATEQIGGANAAVTAGLENLAVWHAEISRASELSSLQIRELAAGLTEDMDAPVQDIVALRESASKLTEGTRDTMLAQAQQLFERITLCRALPDSTLTLLFEATRAHSATNTPSALTSTPRVAILGSPLFHAAKESFAPFLLQTDSLLCKGFTDICERVVAGDAAFGILPLEDSVEGKLFRIYEQLEQCDLHVAYTKDLLSDGKTVRMALLYKTYPPIVLSCGTRTIECVLYEEGDASLNDFLTAASTFGFTLRRIDSLPISYREDGFAKHVVLKAGDAMPELLAAYITLFMPRTVIIADYINIDKELL